MSSTVDTVSQAARNATSETWIPRGEYVAYMLEAGIGEKVHYDAGQFLFAQGEIDRRFYILLSGKVHVFNISNDGHESMFNIMGPGSVIGEAAALTALPRYSAARVMEPSELLQLNVARMEEYISQNPRFAMSLLYVLSLKQRLAVDRLHQAVYEAPDQRILRFLEQMAQTHSAEIDARSSHISVHMTHEQIGNMTNLSRVTVTRTLQKLKRAGRIDLLGRTILLKSPMPSSTARH
ncbi:Crp/Fnr family transcriptional regulator [Variovorax sp. VNK109]|jgi:CRP/FNR family cyclic AMP-dependent transcriptional regulator|uniref:Crp/Fnr family transcriptional regulator n=1 Tax=Variovorax sp. VNK109 TaxID=3400919 RepID=UPI003C010C8E